MNKLETLVNEFENLIANLGERDGDVINRMIDVLMLEFPGREGYDAVYKNLPHLLLCMVEHKATAPEDFE